MNGRDQAGHRGGGLGVEGPGDQHGAAQPGLPDRLDQDRRVGSVGGGRDGAELGREHRQPRPAAGRRGDRERIASRELAQVGQGHPGCERAGQAVDDGAAHIGRVDEYGAKPGFGPVVTQQIRRHPVGHPQRPGQEGTVGVLDDEQPGSRQHSIRPAAHPRGGVQRRTPTQFQGQTRAGPPPAHVVVQVAVELLEPGVKVRSEGDQQDVNVQAGQPTSAGKRWQPQFLPFGRRLGRTACQPVGTRAVGVRRRHPLVGRRW